MLKFNLVNDLASLTNIDNELLARIISKSSLCIGEYINEAYIDGCNISEIDLSFGKLIIGVVDNEIKYKFVPSKRLEESIINSLNNKQSDMEVELSKAAVEKLLANYKELF